MSDDQIESMITELQSSHAASGLSDTRPLSFSIPGTPPSGSNTINGGERTNQQLVRSVLYMSYLIRSGKKTNSSSDFLVDSLETVTSVLDNLYLVTKFGIGKNSKFLQRLSKNASKVWFVTLLFTIKNLVGKIIALVQLKGSIFKELRKCQSNNNNVDLSRMIINKYEVKIEELKQDILGECLELMGSLNDLFFVSIELFDWKINAKVERFVGMISAFMSVYRMTRKS